MGMSDSELSRVRVWDLPTRMFHGLLIIVFVALFLTGKLGAGALRWHVWFGYVAASLVLFRLAWGVAGGYWSRFANFGCAPAMVVRQVRGDRSLPHTLGHSPLGSLSVLAMLTALLLQVCSGMFADDTVEFAGPLTTLVSDATVRALTRYHKAVGQPLLLTLIGLHVGAVVYHALTSRAEVLRAMWTGDKLAPAGSHASADGPWRRLLALVLWAVAGGVVAWVVHWGSSQLGDQLRGWVDKAVWLGSRGYT